LAKKDIYLVRAAKVKKKYIKFLRRQPNLAVLERWAATMTQFLETGLSMSESLNLSVVVGDHSVSNLSKSIHERIHRGQPISDAVASEREYFGEQYPLLFRRAESTGNLVNAFRELLNSVQWQQEMRARIQNVLFYPVLSHILVVSVVLFLLVSVVPQLGDFVETINQQLPAHTQFLLIFSNSLQHSWRYFLILLLLCLFVFGVLPKFSASAQKLKDSLLLRIPVIGQLVNQVRLAKYFHCLFMLAQSKLPLIELLNASQLSLNTSNYKVAISALTERVNAGQTLAIAMQKDKLFPELTWRMVRVGENSGDLKKVFENIRDFYDKEITTTVNKIERYMPMILVSTVGVLLMWMVISVLGPLYESIVGAGLGVI